MYCHICGEELKNQEKNCPNCGTDVPVTRENRNDNMQVTKHRESALSKKTEVEVKKVEDTPVRPVHNGMVCPNCGNENLQVINEVNVNTQTSGGGYSAGKGCCGYVLLGPIGLLCGACGSGAKTTTTTTNTMVFVCTKCGKKFKKPSDLRQEAENVRSGASASFVVFWVIAVLQFIVLAAVGGGESPYVIGGFILGAIFIILSFVLKAKSNGEAESLEEEARQIEQDMKKHR